MSCIRSFFLTLILLSAPVASCNRPESCDADSKGTCQGDNDVTGLMQKKVLVDSIVTDGEAVQEGTSKDVGESNRHLATVMPFPPIHLSKGNITLSFWSAVPTFGPDSSYIAFIHRYDETMWHSLKNVTLFCSGRNNSHEAAMRFMGGESDASYKRVMVWHCDWPSEEAAVGTYEVFIREAEGNEVGKLHTSYKPNLLKKYNTMACVHPVFYGYETRDRSVVPPNSVRQLPQWLEYNHMNGVEHFLFYTIDATPIEVLHVYQPYLEDGIASRIHLKIPDDLTMQVKANEKNTFDSGFTLNDCLYRAKNHARWLMTSIDVDEYIRNSSLNQFNWDSIVDKYNSKHKTVKDHTRIHSISFGLYAYARPQSEQTLLVSSSKREPNPQDAFPKFVCNPSLVNALFVHWPTSWVEGTDGLAVPLELVVANHYRLIASDDKKTAWTIDPVLSSLAPTLRYALEMRFWRHWEILSAELERPTDATLSQVHANMSSKSFLEEQESELAALRRSWMDKLRRLHEVTILTPPSALGYQ